MKIVGQTLFLGASVVSYSVNIGWGGSAGSLQVELAEDFQPFGKYPLKRFDQNKTVDYGEFNRDLKPLPSGHPGDGSIGGDFYLIPHYPQAGYPDNHYYNCSGDECYIDELGRPYGSSPTKKEKNVPGKIYYEWVDGKLVSKYWYLEDPGFFATGTRINHFGVYEAGRGRGRGGGEVYVYNIINTPVYFKFDNFEFIGIVKSWERNARPGGVTYSVTIESFDTLLDNCHIILQSFNGAIFSTNKEGPATSLADLLSRITMSDLGGPINFPNPNAGNYTSAVGYGNLPNVFNVYGFLESMGLNGFGGAKLNSQGLRCNDIIDALQVLTSSANFNVRAVDRAFSPFGRILTKSIADANTGQIIGALKSFGVIASTRPARVEPIPSQLYNSFRLDLSSLPRTPNDYRIQANPTMSISSLVKKISDDTGIDFMTIVVPYNEGSNTDFVIKVITVDRTTYNPIYQIPLIVNDLERKGGHIIDSSSFGQEKNNNYPRKLIFGGNQQRLYQVKNYKLSYNQSTYVYNSITRQFVNLSPSLAKNKVNKIRNPDLFSTRNKILSDAVHPLESEFFLRDDKDKSTRFSQAEGDWGDTEVGRTENIVRGNYAETYIENNNPIAPATPTDRFVPLLNDVISPYFGMKVESQAPIGDGTNEFRLPRPVLLDTWTNQITVVFDMNELPILSIGEPLTLYRSDVVSSSGPTDAGGGLNAINGSITSNQKPTASATNFGQAANANAIEPTRTLEYDAPGFTIKETEFRCPSFDSYLTYCLGKSIYSKPDLFVMLVNAYKNRGMFITSPSANATTEPGPGITAIGGDITANSNSSQNGTPSVAVPGIRTTMNMNWDLYLNHNFIKDLQILFNFIKTIGDTYYGKKYAVKTPQIAAYKDSQFASIAIPSAVGNISVYQGSSEIFYDYEITDGAWEEPGNYIDDSIVCGDPNWHVLRNDDGLIPTIVGYNSSAQIDDVTKFWCELSSEADRRDLLSVVGSVFPNSLAASVMTPQQVATRAEALRRLTSFNFDCSDIDQTNIPSLDVSSLDPSSYIVAPKTTTNLDAFERSVTSSKIYAKANSDQMIFLNPISLSEPRVIVDAPGIPLANSSYSYTSDPSLTVISNIAMEDFAILANISSLLDGSKRKLNTTIPPKEQEYLSYLLSFISPIDSRRLVPRGPSINSSASHQMINPKMATPTFIGVPLKSNRALYGPWTNYPGLVMNASLADNLIGNTKVEQNTDYVPWNYGGMSFLDKVVSYEMNVDVNYQNILENGRVSIVGPPIFGIGGAFAYTPRSSADSNNVYFDNTIYRKNTISIVFNDAGANAVRTYTTKVLGQQLYGNSPIISNISIQTAIDGMKTTYSFQTYNPKTGLFNKQFSDNIKQQNLQNLKFNKAIAQRANSISNKSFKERTSIIERAKESRENYGIARHASQLFGTSPVELIIGQAAEFVPTPSGTLTLDQFNASRRCHHWAGIIPGKEIGAELLSDYDSKAAMSLDGLLSPVSFFPTRLNTTYSLSGPESVNCPRCNNTRKIKVKYVDFQNMPQSTAPREIDIACPACSKSKLHSNNKPLEKSSKKINIYSLNPIVVPTGEFSNSHAGSGISRHSILALARGEKVHTGDENFLLHANLKNPTNNDYNGNQRFFALRGPIILHGWGFDTEGYPVPNATGQPLRLDAENRPLRFVLKEDGTNDLSKQGKFLPGTNERLGDIIPVNYEFSGGWKPKSKKKSDKFHTKWAERPDLWPVGPIDLRWDDERKVWDAGGGCKEEIMPPFVISNTSDNKNLKEFLESNTNNKCPYKMIYITLEQDMIKDSDFEITHPARGFIDDIEYTKEPLSNNYRRLVYVVDTAGYTAPRGAKLLCRYNKDNGFYEPITKPIMTALGSISAGEARIELSYVQGRRSGNIPVYATSFANPLNLRVGSKGLFNYVNGQWILISSG